MNVNFLNQLFSEHFNGGVNGNRNILVSHTNIDIDNISDCSVSDGKEKRELKKYKAVYYTETNGDDNCGMDMEIIEAENEEQALSIARDYPGRLYRLIDKS